MQYIIFLVIVSDHWLLLGMGGLNSGSQLYEDGLKLIEVALVLEKPQFMGFLQAEDPRLSVKLNKKHDIKRINESLV